MTVRELRNVLIDDNELEISVQTKSNGRVEEAYNNQTLFNGSAYEYIADKEIKFIKIEKKVMYIIV